MLTYWILWLAGAVTGANAGVAAQQKNWHAAGGWALCSALIVGINLGWFC